MAGFAPETKSKCKILKIRHKFKNQNFENVSQKNYTPWCLTITLENVDRFSKFFHQVIRRKIVYVHTQRFPPHLQYVATLPCEIRKSKK